MPAYSGYKDYQQNRPSINRADVGEKLVALGSGLSEGATDIATMPVRLGSIAAKEMGMIDNKQMLNNMNMLNDASYALGNYMDNGQAAANNPNTAAIGNAFAPIPPMFKVANRLYETSRTVNPNRVVGAMNKGPDAEMVAAQASGSSAGASPTPASVGQMSQIQRQALLAREAALKRQSPEVYGQGPSQAENAAQARSVLRNQPWMRDQGGRPGSTDNIMRTRDDSINRGFTADIPF